MSSTLRTRLSCLHQEGQLSRRDEDPHRDATRLRALPEAFPATGERTQPRGLGRTLGRAAPQPVTAMRLLFQLQVKLKRSGSLPRDCMNRENVEHNSFFVPILDNFVSSKSRISLFASYFASTDKNWFSPDKGHRVDVNPKPYSPPPPPLNHDDGPSSEYVLLGTCSFIKYIFPFQINHRYHSSSLGSARIIKCLHCLFGLHFCSLSHDTCFVDVCHPFCLLILFVM